MPSLKQSRAGNDSYRVRRMRLIKLYLCIFTASRGTLMNIMAQLKSQIL